MTKVTEAELRSLLHSCSKSNKCDDKYVTFTSGSRRQKDRWRPWEQGRQDPSKGAEPPPFQLGSGDVSTAGLTPSICSDGTAPGLPVLRNFSPVLSDLILPGAGELNFFYVKSLTLRFEQHISMGK